MTARSINRPQYEEREGDAGRMTWLLLMILIFGLALVPIYVCLASPQAGTGMGAIRDVMVGLGGDMAIGLSVVLGWIGVMCFFMFTGRRLSPLRVVADALLIVCAFTAVHVFFVDRIRLERMTIIGYANFISKSYGYGRGGGALGALLAWPLYRSLGVWGGFFATLLIAVLALTATGRVGRLVRFVRKRRQQRPVCENTEQTFETVEPRPRAAARPKAARDPFSETVLGGVEVQAPVRGRKPRAAGGARGGAVPAEDGVSGRPARNAGPARADSPARPALRRRPAGDAMESAADPLRAADPARAPRRRPAGDAASPATRKAAAGKRKKLYIEDVEQAAPAAPTDAERDALFDGFDDFDDIDRMEAGNAALEKRGKKDRARRRDFAPERPTAMKRRQGAPLDVPEEAPAAAAKPVVADRRSNVSIDDLQIQPEAYELPDEDEAPFDVPGAGTKPAQAAEAGIAERKPLPKLKRVKKVEEADPYNYPPIDLLKPGDASKATSHGQGDADMEKAALLEETLQSFGIQAKLTGIAHGPAVTRFELQPAPGVKVSRITALADDIALNLAAMSVRIEAPIPGKAAVGVEIPNSKVEIVSLRDVLESAEARNHPSRIAVGLGKDNSGRYIVADIAKMPHVLIAGQTGSGKSVCINSIIASILFRSTPDEVKLILIDPKMVELSMYNDIPHLVCPVVTDPKKAASALDWAVAEMTKRYKQFAERGVRDIKGYNKALQPDEKPMPQMVIIIDELADLMMVSPGEVEDSICRLAQLARACGMHLVIATQRPSVNVITGIIKANIPTRIAFSVASQVDSRTMIDHGGAEKLLGNGDMLFVPNGMKAIRVQGAWVSDEEVHAIVEYIKQSGSAAAYDPDMLEHLENANRSDAEKEEFEAEYDPKLPEAVDIALELGQVSISMLQRKMRIGYARAGRIIDEMARRGIVSEADGSKPREILISREQAQQLFEE